MTVIQYAEAKMTDSIIFKPVIFASAHCTYFEKAIFTKAFFAKAKFSSLFDAALVLFRQDIEQKIFWVTSKL